jgi:hypothetical protein
VSTFYLNWAAFELPEAEVIDRTTHTIEIRHPDHESFGLVVRQMPMPFGKTVRQMAAERMAAEMARLSGYTVLESREVVWCDAPGIEVVARWRGEGEVFFQRQVHFELGGVLRAFSLAGPLASRAACDEWFEQIRTSLRLRES